MHTAILSEPKCAGKLTKFSFIVPKKVSTVSSCRHFHRDAMLMTANDTVMQPKFSKTILLNGDRRFQHLFLYLLW